VDVGCALVAAEIVLLVLNESTSDVTIVPTCGGGIQLEWHCNQVDLEVEISQPGRIEVLFIDRSTGAVQEFSLTHDLARLRSLIQRVADKQSVGE
jgi:hypothetical protein